MTFARVNRRSDRRMLRHHDVWLVVGKQIIVCRVADVSRAGMKIVMPKATIIPEIVGVIRIPGDQPQYARVAWCKGDHAGLSYEDASMCGAFANPVHHDWMSAR